MRTSLGFIPRVDPINGHNSHLLFLVLESLRIVGGRNYVSNRGTMVLLLLGELLEGRSGSLAAARERLSLTRLTLRTPMVVKLNRAVAVVDQTAIDTRDESVTVPLHAVRWLMLAYCV